jgi:uncharacterized iron-regulated membrane protein
MNLFYVFGTLALCALVYLIYWASGVPVTTLWKAWPLWFLPPVILFLPALALAEFLVEETLKKRVMSLEAELSVNKTLKQTAIEAAEAAASNFLGKQGYTKWLRTEEERRFELMEERDNALFQAREAKKDAERLMQRLDNAIGEYKKLQAINDRLSKKNNELKKRINT